MSDELGDGGLDQGRVEGGVEVGFSELEVELERDGREEVKRFASEDLGKIDVDAGGDEL